MDCNRCSHCSVASRAACLSHRRSTQRRRSQAPVTCFSQNTGGGGQEAMRVSFAVPYRCEFGQHIALVGSDEFLGDWDVQRGVPMNWQDGDVWTVDLELPPTPGMDLQYKYVVRNGDGSVARWMAGDNFSLQTVDGDVEELPSTLRVSDSWDASVHAVEIVELIKSRQAARFAAAVLQQEAAPSSETMPTAAAASTAAAPVSKTVVAPSRSPDSDEIAAIALAAERALMELDAAISSSMELSESSDDPASAEALAADRVVAAAASKALALSKALKSADPTYDMRLLGSQSANSPPRPQ